MIEVREYIRENGDNPFKKWLNKLNKPAAVKIAMLLTRIEQENITSLKSLGEVIYAFPGISVFPPPCIFNILS